MQAIIYWAKHTDRPDPSRASLGFRTSHTQAMANLADLPSYRSNRQLSKPPPLGLTRLAGAGHARLASDRKNARGSRAEYQICIISPQNMEAAGRKKRANLTQETGGNSIGRCNPPFEDNGSAGSVINT